MEDRLSFWTWFIFTLALQRVMNFKCHCLKKITLLQTEKKRKFLEQPPQTKSRHPRSSKQHAHRKPLTTSSIKAIRSETGGVRRNYTWPFGGQPVPQVPWPCRPEEKEKESNMKINTIISCSNANQLARHNGWGFLCVVIIGQFELNGVKMLHMLGRYKIKLFGHHK